MQNIWNLKISKSLEQHGNAVYLFMGAGDVQKYLNAFKELVERR